MESGQVKKLGNTEGFEVSGDVKLVKGFEEVSHVKLSDSFARMYEIVGWLAFNFSHNLTLCLVFAILKIAMNTSFGQPINIIWYICYLLYNTHIANIGNIFEIKMNVQS